MYLSKHAFIKICPGYRNCYTFAKAIQCNKHVKKYYITLIGLVNNNHIMLVNNAS